MSKRPENETAREAHFRTLEESKTRTNRNWVTRHETILFLGFFGAWALSYYLRDKTADGSASDVFLAIVLLVSILGMLILLPLSLIELWRSFWDSVYVARLMRSERKEEQ